MATSDQTISARGQLSKLGSELFPTANVPGWIQGTSTTTGLQGFWLGGDFSSVNFLDGAEAAPVGQEFIFPLATAATELNLANLSINSNNFTIAVYGAAPAGGLSLFNTTQSVPAKGIYKTTLAGLFPTLNFADAMYVKVTGTGSFTGTTVVTDFIHSPSWSVINGIASSSTVTEANFPHVPSGPEGGGAKWTSVLAITNLSSTAQTITITYNRASGSPVSVTRSLAANGSLREAVKDLFSFGAAAEDGWVRVTGTAPLGGFIAYGYSATNGVAVVPVQPVPQTALIFSHVANGPFWGTGLALLNATGTDANIEVYIMRNTGALVGGAQNVLTASIILPAGVKTAKLLDELVPASTNDDGFVYLKSVNNVPLYAFQLFFSRNLQVVANVAAGAVDPSITFTPPAPPTPLPALTTTAITPSPVPRGTVVTITGTGFSTTPGSNAVFFATATGSVSATPTAATAISLSVAVPSTAITGPVYVTTGGRFSNSIVLPVTATSTTAITSSVTVNASQNTIADIYVSPPVATLNANAVGISLTTESSADIGGASGEVSAGTTRRLWLCYSVIVNNEPQCVAGAGINAATTVSISGPGVTVTSSGVTATDIAIVHVTVAAGATAGPRNIILTNSSLDMAIITGGLIVR
jgi:hypothetical protein